MNSPASFLGLATEPRPRRVRDFTWDRILFQPPALLNPRQIFDPLPFRAQALPRRPRTRAPFDR
jgi:hypothetical protein